MSDKYPRGWRAWPWAWIATVIGLIGAAAVMLSPNQPVLLLSIGWVCALAAIILGSVSAWYVPKTRARAISGAVIGVAVLALMLVIGSHALG